MKRFAPHLLAIGCALSLPMAVLAAPSAETNPAEQAVAVETDALAVADFDALVKMAGNHPNELHRIYANTDCHALSVCG